MGPESLEARRIFTVRPADRYIRTNTQSETDSAATTMQQRQPRARGVSTNVEGMIYGTDGKWIAPCRQRNISISGAQLELKRETELPGDLELERGPSSLLIHRRQPIPALQLQPMEVRSTSFGFYLSAMGQSASSLQPSSMTKAAPFLAVST